MSRLALTGLMAVVMLTGGVYLTSRRVHNLSMTSKSQPNNPSPSPSPTPSGDQFQPGQSSTSSSTSISSHSTSTVSGQTTIAPVTISLTLDQNSGNQSVNVTKGAQVKLTFNVTGSAGLEFKSSDPSLNTGLISPGGSKTIEFTATKSFEFIPYAGSSQKGYAVSITAS